MSPPHGEESKKKREQREKRQEEEAMGSVREGKTPKRDESSPKPAPVREEAPGAGSSAITLDGASEDECLRDVGVLSREEVLRRRSRRLKMLSRCYNRHYWALMEDLRGKHRDYYWEHGVSPFEEDEEEEADGGGGRWQAAEENGGGLMVGGSETLRESGRTGGARLGFAERECSGRRSGERKRCAFSGCKSKAMPLTKFCHPHILADKNQTLYKACTFVIRSCGQSGPITCGKPILRATVPSLCHVHFQKVQRSITQAMRKVAISVPSASRSPPKFSVLLAACVNEIQDSRKETLNHKDEQIS
ncbi:INO80 complex subunit D-like isoform X2 [Canna indica]|uniref:KAT8 regulatory NSL complex subunit 2 n=1 Tax=Canna indica TaxID=4628 RepID=A0AAQ3KSR0_9LILI|nr:INO80 complex subunit D-like isoform X2 [Canna indica]